MYFLKHVLPLVIVSVLIGYVVARVGFPPSVNNAEVSGSGVENTATATDPQNAVVTSSDPASPPPPPDEVIRRVTEVVSESENSATADARDSYTDEVNREIEAAIQEWSSGKPADAGIALTATDTVAEKVEVATTTTEPYANTGTEAATASEPQAQVAEDSAESAGVDASTAQADASGDEMAPTAETISVALADSPARTSDEDELAAAVAAELEEQAQADQSASTSAMSLEELLGARWTLGNEPAAPHLPSFVTSCKSNGTSAECWSGEYIVDPGRKTRARTKSIIRDTGASGFTIRYRNMVTDPGQQRGYWDKKVKQLDCSFQTQSRIRCENKDTGQEFTYTRVTSEQFVDRFTLSSLAATRWYSGGKPAVYLPSGTTRCDSEAAELVCWTNARTVQSAQGPASVKTKSLLRKTGEGTFTATYRNQVTNAAGQSTWEPGSRRSDCEVKGFERIVCIDAEGTHSFAKAVFEL